MIEESNPDQLIGQESEQIQSASENLNKPAEPAVQSDQAALPKTNFSKIIVLTLLALVIVSIPAGLFIYNKYFTVSKTIESDELMKVDISPTPTIEPFMLSVDSPAEGDLIVDNKVTVKGKTLAGATVLIFTETNETSVESDAFGNYSADIELESGINSLTVTAVAEDGEEKSLTVNIVNDSSN